MNATAAKFVELTAARTQAVTVAGEATAATIVAQTATDLEAVNDRITAIEEPSP
ncbi:hypothetical protein [Micromonospora sp. CNB394]|uniref:hypothetical protein n=1 Tax=Micromonospora sp. CNB394 TaxID=1169151 RepID=UPI0003787ED5|nr:hypothetical protein [Micromonospora sp. CNB394]